MRANRMEGDQRCGKQGTRADQGKDALIAAFGYGASGGDKIDRSMADLVTWPKVLWRSTRRALFYFNFVLGDEEALISIKVSNGMLKHSSNGGKVIGVTIHGSGH